MKVLIAGDFSLNKRDLEFIQNKNFEGKFVDIRDLTSNSDFSIVNFETNVSTPDSLPIEKHGPNLTTIPQSVDSIKYIGFNVVTLANNHFFDYGDNAVFNTLNILDDKNIKHVGGGRNIKEAENTLYLKQNSDTLAIINACEHEFTIADENHGGSNPIDPVKLFYTIQEARKNADYVLVILHGGHEHYQLPSVRMQETYRFFIDAGADAVVNHHQHCFSGYEVYHEKPIFYGLGNFLFNKKNYPISSWYYGYLVELDFNDNKVNFKLHPYEQCKTSIGVKLLNDASVFHKKIEELNKIISNPVNLRKANEEYYDKSVKSFLTLYQPYDNRILNKLYRLHLLPSLVSKKKILRIYNYINCESHRDKQLFALEKIIGK